MKNSEFPLLLATELPFSALERRWRIFCNKLRIFRNQIRVLFNEARIFLLKTRYAFLVRW